MDIRNTINLIEAKSHNDLTMATLPYARGALSPVLSKTNIDFHYGKLYRGYVDRYNSHEGDPNFNQAGAYLHELFFTQLQSPRAAHPIGRISDLIDRHFDNFTAFKDEFKQQALKVTGSGWIYLSKNGQIKTIHNHAQRTDIALILDMWEHSYQTDYGANKSRYVDNFWRIINWSVINHRL
jgi:Fe-Mn family superoxide dismutase